ncbi:MAG: ABC transporter permease [Chthoniobacterales bacterium]
MIRDVRLALRALAKTPAFSIIAVLTVALAISANTAVFSLVNALLIRPLPFHQPGRLALILQHFHAQGLEKIPMSAPEFVDYQQRVGSFEKIGAFTTANYNLASADQPERFAAAVVTSGVFDALGVSPLRGRTFTPEECQPGHDDVVVISARLWERRFNSDPNIIGKLILLDGRSCTVVGVMPESFDFPIQLYNVAVATFSERTELWTPLAFTPQQLQIRYSRGLLAVARLKPDATFRSAQAEIETVNAQMRRENPNRYPNGDSFGADVLPLQDLAAGSVRPMLLILLAAVALVLLIACANLGTMLLARAAAREREMAIRVALGAGRLAILREVLSESVVLALGGGTIGVLLAFWGVDLLKRIGAQTVPRLQEVNIDSSVLLVTLGVTVLTGLLFGLVPALTTARPQLSEALKEGGRGSTEGTRRNVARNVLVIAEVALALVLLTSAGLLIKSFAQLQRVDAGFNPHNVLTMEISLPVLTYPKNDDIVRFAGETRRRVAQVSGVTSAAITDILPLSGNNSDWSFMVEGRVTGPNEPGPDEEIRHVTPDYFTVLQTPLLAGRAFTLDDMQSPARAVVVNEAFAKKFWPNGDALGKRITFDDPTKNPVWVQVVGIVASMHHLGLDADVKPEMYMPITHSPPRTMILTLRSNQDPRALIANVRRELKSIDPGIAIAYVRPMEQIVGDSIAARRLSVVLLGAFAAVAVVLASVGIYGVISFLVVQRTHEIGVRMALGAQRGDVLKLVIGRASRLIIGGTIAGLFLAVCSTRTLATLLYRVSAFDLSTFALVTLLLAAVALLASYIPAVRATRADPMLALGHNA